MEENHLYHNLEKKDNLKKFCEFFGENPEDIVKPMVFRPGPDFFSKMQELGYYGPIDVTDENGSYLRTIEIRQLKFMPIQAFVILGHRIVMTLPTLSSNTDPNGDAPDGNNLDFEEIALLNHMISGMISLAADLGDNFASPEWDNVAVIRKRQRERADDRKVTLITPMPKFVNAPGSHQISHLSEHVKHENLAALKVIWGVSAPTTGSITNGIKNVGWYLTGAALKGASNAVINRVLNHLGISGDHHATFSDFHDLIVDANKGLMATAVPNLDLDLKSQLAGTWYQTLVALTPNDPMFHGRES